MYAGQHTNYGYHHSLKPSQHPYLISYYTGLKGTESQKRERGQRHSLSYFAIAASSSLISGETFLTKIYRVSNSARIPSVFAFSK